MCRCGQFQVPFRITTYRVLTPVPLSRSSFGEGGGGGGVVVTDSLFRTYKQ